MTKAINCYINDILNKKFYNFPDEQPLAFQTSEETIYEHITSSKFRKTKVLPDAETDIKEKKARRYY